MRKLVICVLVAAVTVSAQEKPTSAPPMPQKPGRSEPTFQWPSIAPGVDYTLPTEAEIKAPLDRVLGFFAASTPYRVIDTKTGQPITDLKSPTQTAGIDTRTGEFNDWTYSMGVTMAAMLQVADVTGDKRFEEYTRKNFEFIFDHIEYFRAQAKQFGPQPQGYRRLVDMHELDDCGAIGAALIKFVQAQQGPALQAGDRPDRRLHHLEDAAHAGRDAVAAASTPGVGVGRRPVYERPVSRADGRPDRATGSTSTMRRGR